MSHWSNVVARGADVAVLLRPGLTPEMDGIAGAHGFLRSAWFGVPHSDSWTLVATRGDGSPLLALPTAPVGPGVVGARVVPGSY